MCKGDILLLHNRFDPVSWFIAWFTHSKWSHVAWVLDDKYLIEIRSPGIVKTPISKYKRKWIYRCKLVRLKNYKFSEIDKAVDYGLSFKEKRNYFQFIWSLIIIGFEIHTKQPYMSCSGFIAYCLNQKVGIKLHNNKNPLYVVPKDISKSKEIKDVSKELKY